MVLQSEDGTESIQVVHAALPDVEIVEAEHGILHEQERES